MVRVDNSPNKSTGGKQNHFDRNDRASITMNSIFGGSIDSVLGNGERAS